MNCLNIYRSKEKASHFFVCLVFLLSLILLISGCGSSNSSTNTLSVSPLEDEIKAVLNSFTTSINATDTAKVMSVFDSNIKYFISPFTPIFYTSLTTRFDNFFNKATNIDVRLDNIAVLSGSDSSATVRALLTYSYNNLGSVSEEVEIEMEKIPTWGIKEFYRYDDKTGITGTNFPPSL